MSLSLYKKKRDFKKTAEPEAKEKSSKGGLRFVIQKHDASHLHYDFRLEMEGVLKSWAVPKGPSLNPADKRLAMMVEDHPFDYRNFEGVIPAGEYGGGTVIVWDEGTYELMDGENLSRKEQEKNLLAALHKGDLKIVLHGKKIKGAFALFRMKGKEERTWLLVKKADEFAATKEITKNETSVKSGKTIPEIAQEHGTVPNHPEAHKKKIKAEDKVVEKKKTAAASGIKKNAALKKVISSDAVKDEMPKNVVPMLATLTDDAFDDENWIFEIKWDGYRAVAYCNGDDVELSSRNLKSFTHKYTDVTDALKELNINAVLDGEIIAIDEKGHPKFQLLQNWEQTTSPLQYYAFDILWLNGYDVTSLPLTERKTLLHEIIPATDPIIKYSDHIVGRGKEFFNAAMKQDLEGIMAKKADSVYLIKTRTPNWAKIKVVQRQEVVIAGYTKPRNSRKHFGALLLGVYDGNELKYVGHTGSGFNTKSLDEVYKKLQPLVTDKSPFDKKPKTNMPATWVKPKLVAELKFSEWTDEGIARHPIFMGLRSDKKATDVTLEKKLPMAKIKTAVKKSATAKKATAKKIAPKKVATKSRSKRTEKVVKTSGKKIDPTGEKDQLIKLDGHELKLTNLQKIYWPKEKFSKGDMINYYLQIVPYMLPHILNRPHSLNRHPNGINSANFYQKDVEGKVPEWVETFAEFSESNNETIRYFVCSNEASLIYMANLGCIEINPWHGRTMSSLNPDWSLIDLDPDDGNTFNQVIEVAHVVKKILDAIGADCYVKTSGSSGIHIYIPLGAKYSYEQSRQLAELVANFVHAELPDFTSVERSPAKRKGKIYLDYLQNRETPPNG
jgi:bifunctional non-homologous end joining protein LigD